MKRVFLLIVVLSSFLTGCEEFKEAQCAELESSEEQAECCSTIFSGRALPACIGSWVVTEEGSCSYQCDTFDELEIVEECDALNPCPVGDCYIFPDDSNAICFEGDPCSECSLGECVVAESYPMQVFCE